MADNRLQLEDTFDTWRQKINAEFESGGVGSFPQDFDTTVGLTFGVGAGKLRLGSEILDVAASTHAIDPLATTYVMLYHDPIITEIRTYVGSYPESSVIPLFEVTTDATEITSVIDQRTWVNFSGSASESDAILTFNQSIAFDKTIPTGKNGLSIEPVVEDGVTVTVSQDSVWVVL